MAPGICFIIYIHQLSKGKFLQPTWVIVYRMLSESHFKDFCTFAVKEVQKAKSPDPAAVEHKPEEPKPDESKPEEPKEPPPAPSENSAPDSTGPPSDGVAPEGEYKNTHRVKDFSLSDLCKHIHIFVNFGCIN